MSHSICFKALHGIVGLSVLLALAAPVRADRDAIERRLATAEDAARLLTGWLDQIKAGKIAVLNGRVIDAEAMSVKMAEDLVSGQLTLEQAGKLTRRMINETARVRERIQAQLDQVELQIAGLGAPQPEEGAQDDAPADDAANDAAVRAIKGWASSTVKALGDGRGDQK